MKDKIFISFPIKITITFFIISLTITIPIFYYFYNVSRNLVMEAIQNRIKDIGKTSLFLFSEKNLETLKKLDHDLNQKIKNLSLQDWEEIKKVEPGDSFEILSEEENEMLYNEKEYKEIIQILRKIKAGTSLIPIQKEFYEQKFYPENNKPFLRFVYILSPILEFPDFHFVKFLADADMEEEDINNNGKIDPDESKLKISTLYNISSLPNLKKVFIIKQIECENEFYKDQWGIWLSCYIPIFDKNEKFIGILGLDLDVRSESNKLNNLKENLILSLSILTFAIAIFSYIISKLLSKPILKLSNASIQVSNKKFDIELKIPSNDEIGILTKNFNFMVKEIKEYSEHLEELVAKRTKELQESLETIQKLKNLQDGDYFLMSLLIDPLIKNLNKSNFVETEIFIKQKKEFEFKGKKREIGGDLCITGNLRFKNNSNEIERWIFFLNGDAMGKSSQGAGGVLVMGALLNAILARSAAKDKILQIEPIKWLHTICFEIQKVFLKFDGHMLVSAAMGILSEKTGKLYYLNFEHPKTILYRNKKASFIEESTEVINYKFGFPFTNQLKVLTFYLEKNDILILGSDGREDIIFKETNEMNRDEEYILKIVERADGNLNQIYNFILETGIPTDDISFLKIYFHKNESAQKKQEISSNIESLKN